MATSDVPQIETGCPACQHTFLVEAMFVNCKRPCPECGEKCLVQLGEGNGDADGGRTYVGPGSGLRQVPVLFKVFAVLMACLAGLSLFLFQDAPGGLAILMLCLYGAMSAGFALGHRWVIVLVAIGACIALLKAIIFLGLGDYAVGLRALMKLVLIQTPILIVAARSWDELV